MKHILIIIPGSVLTPEDQRQIANLGVDSFLDTDSVTTKRIKHMMETVGDNNTWIASIILLLSCHSIERHRQCCDKDRPVLTAKDRALLMGLAKGMTQQQVADDEQVGLRTIEDRILKLKDKLGVSTMFALGAKAERLGIFYGEPDSTV